MKKYYIKHLVECQCTLKIFEKETKPVYHKFPVFSITDEIGNIESKYVSCNNCQIIHQVDFPFKSEILWGKEGIKSYVRTIDDIKFNLESENVPLNIIEILFREKCDVSTWEQIEFVLENELEGEIIKLSEEDLSDKKSIKYLEFKNKKFKIKNAIVQKDLTIK